MSKVRHKNHGKTFLVYTYNIGVKHDRFDPWHGMVEKNGMLLYIVLEDPYNSLALRRDI